MQKTASPYLIMFRNEASAKLTGRTILLYKNDEFWVSMAHILGIKTLSNGPPNSFIMCILVKTNDIDHIYLSIVNRLVYSI